MAINLDDMTPEDVEAHVQKELQLREEMNEFLRRLENNEFRTKTEKLYLYKMYQAKQLELDIHMGYAEPPSEEG